MDYLRIIPMVKLEEEHTVKVCEEYGNNGADALLLTDGSKDSLTHEFHISLLKKIKSTVEIPFITGGNVNRLEDVKKYLYAGAQKVFLEIEKPSNRALIKEASERFGKERIALYLSEGLEAAEITEEDISFVSLIIVENNMLDDAAINGLKNISGDISFLLLTDLLEIEKIQAIQKEYPIYGLASQLKADSSILEIKNKLKGAGVPVFTFTSTMEFSEFKLNNDNLIPVVVQDYKTNEVLMMAYMNEEAFYHTLDTGKMTYYSRSRQELWIKGLTSGHFQYVKELRADCDNDTLLAKVFQVGAACHTGEYSCFHKILAKKEGREDNPFTVFQEVFKVILDRKEHPKEGSYTNYLFDKGIDKILKKLGEEATEIIIAAKNTDPEEIKYEISDFLYHMMVLMAEKEVTWEDVTQELGRR